MRRKLCVVLASLVLLGLFIITPPTHAQEQVPTLLAIIYPAAEPRDESLQLSVFFMFLDASGRPVARTTNIESATIQLLNSTNNQPVTANIDQPASPIYISLLLDASGSIHAANLMPAIRAAATEALNSAPPNAYFGVYRFHEFLELQDTTFLNDPVRVGNAIKRVESVPNGSTCLYNAVFDAANQLQDQIQAPQERRAIILFTDGVDERRGGGTCSTTTFDEVMSRARPPTGQAPVTPIHTIGLCSDASCGNINAPELQLLARETRAFSAIGGPDQLGELFQEIMEGLNAQWAARATVYPDEGINQGILQVKLRDFPQPLSEPFTFVSPRDYNVPTGPPDIFVNSITYDPVEDVYNLSLGLTNPQQVARVIVQVWDSEGGVQVPSDQIFENPGESLQFERPTEGFTAGRGYIFRIRMEGRNGLLIVDEEDETDILAEAEVTYEPPAPGAVEFTIQSVTQQLDPDQIIIDLDVPEEGRVRAYEGFLVNEDTGQRVHEFRERDYMGSRIIEPIPEDMTTEQATYRVTMYLTTFEGQRSAPVAYEEFTIVPPPAPTFWQRLGGVLSNPFVLIAIFVIAFATTITVVMFNRPKEKEYFPRPPMTYTVDDLQEIPSTTTVDPLQTRAIGLRITVVYAPDMSQPIERFITDFPCVIGRTGAANINIDSDTSISRRHVQITKRGSRYYIADMKSNNGTTINNKAIPTEPTLLNIPCVVDLGRRTRIKIELQS